MEMKQTEAAEKVSWELDFQMYNIKDDCIKC